jgi:hypothetical protein
MTKLEFINKFFFQWLFVRITRWSDEKYKGYGILIGVLPLTGWFSDYIKLKIPHIKLTKKVKQC